MYECTSVNRETALVVMDYWCLAQKDMRRLINLVEFSLVCISAEYSSLVGATPYNVLIMHITVNTQVSLNIYFWMFNGFQIQFSTKTNPYISTFV